MTPRDERDPIFHDVQGEAAEAAILERHERWLDLQDDDVRPLFCEHARYVGFGKVFAYKCPQCAPGYEEDV